MAAEDIGEWSAHYGHDGIRWHAALTAAITGGPATEPTPNDEDEAYVMSWRAPAAGGTSAEDLYGDQVEQPGGGSAGLDGSHIVRNIASFFGLSR